jgi:hypothetical protein
MKQPLRLFSEPFAATGNMHGAGFQRLLGRPPLSLVQTVVREALQNCVDATTGTSGPEVLLRMRTLAPTQQENLRKLVFPQLPRAISSRDLLRNALQRESLRVLEICDFNTVGLAGATRADLATEDDEPSNFVNFLRNVGAARDVHHGGGTYGYGKTSLYALSGCGTIVTDSLTTFRGRPTRRVMGCHLGESFRASGPDGSPRHFTGRHWWGGEVVDGSLEPATGGHAEAIASALGMPERPPGRSGTTIMILDPRFESDDAEDVKDELIEAVLWNFWPRMAASTPSHRQLRVSLEIEGAVAPIPRPEDFPPLDLFAQALERHRRKDRLTEIPCGRPKKVLGNLVMCSGLTGQRIGPAVRSDSAIPRQACHIALMRPVELIVRYLPGDAFADPRYEWAGVFICSEDDEVESAFADAEPPAHDDWIPSNLPNGNARTFVRVALRRLTEHARRFTQATGVSASPQEGGPSLAHTASVMGRLLATSLGQGPGRPPSKSRTPGSRRKGVAVRRPRFRGLETGPLGERIAWFEAELINDGRYRKLKVVVEPHLVADGGRADDGDLPDEYRPRLVSLQLPSASLSSSTNELVVGTHSGVLRIAVQTPANAAAGVRTTLHWD